MATKDFFMKDDRKRISELRAVGYEIKSLRCDKRCKIEHSSGVKMRRLVAEPKQEVKSSVQVSFIHNDEGDLVARV